MALPPAAPPKPLSGGERVLLSPNFALKRTLDGRPFVAREVEPYDEFWLSEDERNLLHLVGARRGDTIDGVMDAFGRLHGMGLSPWDRSRLADLLTGMRDVGLVVGRKDDSSRYDAAMAADYLKHRAFPAPLTDLIAGAVGMDASTRALDLAAGPGSLALQLAERSPNVAMMELSRGFVAAARKEARSRGLALEVIHESCNRLPSHDGVYDLITISQALHWLDDVAVCRGVRRVLADHGSFVVVLGALDIPPTHPLGGILGDHSPLGAKSRTPFRQQAQAVMDRLALLFAALDTPDVERIDKLRLSSGGTLPIRPSGGRLYRERRIFDAGYARAFLTPAHLAQIGADPARFWPDLEARCRSAGTDDLFAAQDWAVLRFSRGGVVDPIVAPGDPVALRPGLRAAASTPAERMSALPGAEAALAR